MRTRVQMRRLVFLCFILFFLSHIQGFASRVTVRDCVQVRYITETWMNSQGTQIVYMVKTPDIIHNENHYDLFVKDLSDTTRSSGRHLISGEGLTNIKWLRDGRHLMALESSSGGKNLISVDVEDGAKEVWGSFKDIDDYAVDGKGEVIAYTVADAALGFVSSNPSEKRDNASGYRVDPDGTSSNSKLITSSVYVIHRIGNARTKRAKWTAPRAVSFEDPFSHKRTTHLLGPLQWLTLSPNGMHLTVDYWSDASFSEWQTNPWVHFATQASPLRRVMLVQNLITDKTSIGFKTVFPDSGPLWSSDSKSYVMNSHAPVGSIWEERDVREHRTMGLDANLYIVDVESGNAEEVYHLVPFHHELPMSWNSDGSITLQASGTSVVTLNRVGSSWKPVRALTLPDTTGGLFSSLSSNGHLIMGIHESLNVSPDLFVYGEGSAGISLLTDLNPQLKSVSFAPSRMVSWTTQDGLEVKGILFMPPDYQPGHRYPLVIQTKGDQGWFTCDSGANHDPSFVPQPLANAGIMYLVRTVELGYNQHDEIAKWPGGYPGTINDAVFEMHIWDAAVEELDHQGMIDPTKVGIIGFSATGWYVEFALIHGKTQYAAATASDNVQYSLSEYWLDINDHYAFDRRYGGPPSGDSLNNWLKYSISFNLDKIHTPLLIENMGYGVLDTVKGTIPLGMATRMEVLRGLSWLKKPVEMYYYPNESHTPDHPQARLASLQRNVDWYRFWLQSYERDRPDDPAQYTRWKHLRDLLPAPSTRAQ